MSDVQAKVEAAFADSSKKLSDLSKKLNKIADLEEEMSSLSSNLQLSSNGLRKLTKEHASYLQKVDDLNSVLALTAETLGQIDPDKLEDRLKSIERECNDLRNRIRESETLIKKAVDRVFYIVCSGILGSGGILLLLLRAKL
jgi:predicted  nucleic acid-binding Zn-ribbon protein